MDALKMDALNDLMTMSRKRKSYNTVEVVDGKKEFKTRGQIEEEEQRAKEEAQRAKRQKTMEDDKEQLQSSSQYQQSSSSSSSSSSSTSTLSSSDSTMEEEETVVLMDKTEVFRRLRAADQPVTLFGETDAQRVNRLKEFEKNHVQHGGFRNEWAEALARTEMEALTKELEGTTDDTIKAKEAQAKKDRFIQEYVFEDLKPEGMSDALYIRKFLRFIMYRWEDAMNNAPEEVRNRPGFKTEMAQRYVCETNIKSFLKQLKKGTAPEDIVPLVKKIVDFCKQQEYVKAQDQYLQMAIGNAAWPMGVTMVGIHERSAREKIFNANTAHVLNDETQRKYIQAIKRLMSVCQELYPTDPSKTVG